MTRLLVIGECGQLAQALRGLNWPAGFTLELHGRRSLGTEFRSDWIVALARATGAQAVINAAAYTAVDRAESEPLAARALNAELPSAAAAACRELAIPLVHVSTDYVFDGRKRMPYVESDAPAPLSVYGRTKLAGDDAIRGAAPPAWAILRASWVVSEIGESFPVKLLRRARAGESLRVVDDQRGCPTAAPDLAGAIREMVVRLLDRDVAAQGLYNFCGGSEMSWFGLAERLLAAGERLGLARPPLEPITTAQLGAAARRPAYSVLSCARIRLACGLSGTSIEAHLEPIVRRILGA